MNHAPPATIRDRLLSEAVDRHEVSATAIPAIQDLLHHGLSFEQVLVGTGLISASLFTDWMQKATGLRVMVPVLEQQTLPPGLEKETVRAWRVVPQAMGENRWTIGLSDPWDLDVRSALEAIAVEQGWVVECAYVSPSDAERWLQFQDEHEQAEQTLRAYARSLVKRAECERSLTLVQRGRFASSRASVQEVPASWFGALRLRLLRRASMHPAIEVVQPIPLQTRHPILHLRSKVVPKEQRQEEHPVKEWTDAVQRTVQEGRLLFLLDQQGELVKQAEESHILHQTANWRVGGRWIAHANPGQREELFHLALSGYPGTVCFRSLSVFKDWERAANVAHVSYTACIGQPTDQGMAWSFYQV